MDARQAVTTTALGEVSGLRVDLTHLAFADVATIRRLAAFAGHARRAGPEVTTCGAHPTVRRVAGLLQVHGELGLSRPAPSHCG